MRYNHPVFFVPASGTLLPSLIDEAVLNSDGHYIGRYSRETLEAIAARYGKAVAIGEWEDFVASKEAMMKSPPAEITEDDFNAALEVLPPDDYCEDSRGTSFKCCERLSGRITSIYACANGRHFSFNDVDSLTHRAIMDKVHAAAATLHEAVSS